MGAPAQGMKAAAEDLSAEVLLSKLENIAAAERRRHATVFNYWLSIRGDRHFPPIRDLDPLEISDAGPSSVLLELIGGGEDAEIRHLGQALKDGPKLDSISQAPFPSLLSCIAKQLPVIANARQAIAFEDEYSTEFGNDPLLGDPPAIQLDRDLRRLCLRLRQPGRGWCQSRRRG